MVILFSVAAFCATFLGGLFALRLKDRLHLILGFSAGAVLGVAFFDLIPESLELANSSYDVSVVMSVLAIGFTVFLVLDRMITLHSHADHSHGHERRGLLGAGSLSIHSFLDGIALGLAFQVSSTVGFVVTLAVLAHDFSDGINTVGMILRAGGSRTRALKWLIADACAPVLGVLFTFLFSVSESQLALLLALFSGFFLYIGASDLLPESHHAHPVYWTTAASILGIATMYIVIRVVSV